MCGAFKCKLMCHSLAPRQFIILHSLTGTAKGQSASNRLASYYKYVPAD